MSQIKNAKMKNLKDKIEEEVEELPTKKDKQNGRK